ncbi:sulfotransferase family protein [Nocardioides caldifontis]|uniref:sulfotransferase family protein n=1 Tax=Nocardioides caldifontis TaxID=2588938 RepID=UPI0011E05DB1|nr:sulfotransferase [Nocardioides caldifontis]
MAARRLPDFVIGGAPRSGTTLLASLLDRHPRLWLAKPLRPEPKFFLVDELYAEGLDRYARWFDDAPPDAVVGEKSTNYLESPVAAERLARALPEARLVFVLREPAARTVSNYRWSVMNGMEDEEFERALELEEEREATVPTDLRYARPHAYASRSRYATLLRPWLDRFPRDHVLVLRFEELVGDPGAATARVHRFLGVEPRPALVDDVDLDPATVNPSSGPWTPDPATLRRLRRQFAEENEVLAAMLGPEFEPWPEEEPPR